MRHCLTCVHAPPVRVPRRSCPLSAPAPPHAPPQPPASPATRPRAPRPARRPHAARQRLVSESRVPRVCRRRPAVHSTTVRPVGTRAPRCTIAVAAQAITQPHNHRTREAKRHARNRAACVALSGWHTRTTCPASSPSPPSRFSLAFSSLFSFTTFCPRKHRRARGSDHSAPWCRLTAARSAH